MELGQSATVPELYFPATEPGRLAYLLPKGTPQPPASLTLAESWGSRPGAYLFLAEAPTDEGWLAEAAWAFLADRRLAGTRFAWLAVPARPGLANGPALQVDDGSSGARLAFPAGIPVGSLELTIAAGASIALVEGGVPAFELTTPAGGLRLFAGWGAVATGTAGTKLRLPLSGSLAGCLQLSLTTGLGDLEALDCGLRWFYAIPPKGKSTAPGGFFLGSLRLPLFAAGTALYPNLDPLAPLDESRTYLAFNGADAEQPGEAESVPSRLRTILGKPVKLKPLTGAGVPSGFAALALARKQIASAPSPRDPVYLVPRGDFELEAEERRLMCGLSGVEYVELAQSAPSVVSFFPGASAYEVGFKPREPPNCNSLEPKTTPTTSCAQVTARGETLPYFAQPDQSVLYNHDESGKLAAAGFTTLAAVPVQAGGIASPPAAAKAFPLLPYAGLEGDLASFRQLESQVISPRRRKKIAAAQTEASRAAAAEAATEPVSRLSTTPQGLLASYVQGKLEWEEVVLGKMANGAQLELKNVKGDLLDAFQSNKLFLVATLPASMPIPPGASQIAIGSDPAEEWKFDLEPGKWLQQPQTVLIFKFHDLPIAKLVKDPSTWASPQTFNKDPAEVSKQLLETIEKADPNDCAAFLAAVESPAWNGVLALNVKCPLEELPSQLAGLAVGIDKNAFYAHHLGIALSKIDARQPQLSNEGSSIFGLLHYKAKGPLPAKEGEYAFQVQELKVTFLQSAVANFSSTLELEVNSLFGEPATLENPPEPKRDDNVVELFGVYQKHVVGNRVEESYVFQTPLGAVSVFAMDSGVLNAVTFSKGQFVTLTGKSSPGSTLTQFLFWGQLDFRELPFDAFSFGRAQPKDAATGLAFGNLVLGMSFDPEAEDPTASFEFDAAGMTLDVAASAPPREHSLFRHFPLTVAGLTQGKSGTTPDGLGYMGVQTPLTQSPLTYPWFSLNYDLDLGSPGALAAEAGFVASLCVAWSPARAPAYTAFTGLRLPGSSGAKRQISIEGIFDIGFRTIAILSPAQDTYALLLYGISFEFLKFTFPPEGQVNFVLFGDPKSTGPSDTTIGWYAAYAKAGSKPSPKAPAVPLSAAPSAQLLEREGSHR